MTATANLVLKGTRYYSADSKYRSKRLKAGAAVDLVHTPYNFYDSNAVAVFLASSCKQLGHISAQVAPKYASIVDNNRVTSAEVISVDRTSSGFLRVEVGLRIQGHARPSGTNFLGTTQEIPPRLEPVLRQDRLDRQREWEEKARQGVERCAQEAARARIALNAAENELLNLRLTANDIAGLRNKKVVLERTYSKYRQIAGAAGLVVGGMTGGFGAAIFWGLVGYIAFIVSGSSKVREIDQQISRYEHATTRHEEAERSVCSADVALREAKGNLHRINVSPVPPSARPSLHSTSNSSSAPKEISASLLPENQRYGRQPQHSPNADDSVNRCPNIPLVPCKKCGAGIPTKLIARNGELRCLSCKHVERYQSTTSN